MTTQFDPFDIPFKIDNFLQCQRLHSIAQECLDVHVVDANGSMADAKSLLSLMSLDFSREVRIIASTSEEIFAIQNALQLK